MNKLKYDSYKNSGIEWIGEIPSGWRLYSGSYLGEYSKGKGIKKDEVLEFGLPCLRYGEIYTHYDLKFVQTRSFIKDETSENSVSYGNGTLFLTGSGEKSEEIGKCVVYLGENQIWVGGDIIVLKPYERFNPLFLSYLINSECIRIQREISSKGVIIVHIYSKNFREMKFPIPPLSEQSQIVQFLDEKTSLIDSLIEKTKRKIELLKEERTSLINHTVTKGLNPNVEMKNSGVEWIGEIPRGWVSKKIGYISKLLTGNPWKSDLFNFENGIKIVRGENVSEGFLRWGTRTRFWVEEISYDSVFFLKERDIIVGMDGSKVGKNYVKIKDEDLPLLLHQRMCRIRVNDNYDSTYIEYWISSEMFRFYIDISKTDPMIPHITQKNIFDFQIPFPSLSEQEEIVQFLDEKTSIIDKTIELEGKRIDYLKEYRQSLISEVVTGKIKVVN